MDINKSYPCKQSNYRKGRRDKIKYIVIHYVGATGSALDNVKYYGSANVGASAHYYVGHASENGAIYQSVAPENCAWHCGSETGKYYSACRNDSAIGIEMCCHKADNGTWYFDDITVEKTIELTKWLMSEYNISIDNVIRHYDVTHKNCPAPFVENVGAWQDFKERIGEEEMTREERIKFNALVDAVSTLTEKVDKLTPFIYNYIDDNMPEWARPTIQKMVDKGILRGNEKGELGLNETMLKVFVTNDRAGLYDK